MEDQLVETMIGLPEEDAFFWINEYNLADTAEKDAKKRKDEAKQEILNLMGSAQIGICGAIKVSYTPQKRVSVDTKALQNLRPDVFDEFKRETEFYTMRISNIK